MSGSGGLVSGLVGAAVGFAIGGPTGALYGYSIGSAAGSILFAPKINTEGPRLTDLSIQSSAEGQPIYKIYGAMRTAGNVIWGKPIAEKKKKKKSGGKGGGGQTTTTYSYTVDFAVALCEGPITAIRKIWADGKLIYDMSVLTAAEQAIVDAGGFVPNVISRVQSSTSKTTSIVDVGGTMRIYTGTETQLPDPLIESDLGVGNTPAYRGTCYIVFDNFKLADFGNRIPNITAEVVAAGDNAPAYLGKIEIPETSPAPPDADGGYKTVFHYISSSKSVGLGIWIDNLFQDIDVPTPEQFAAKFRATPITVFPSGTTVFGVDMAQDIDAAPTNDYRLNIGYCDEPGTVLTLFDDPTDDAWVRWTALPDTPPRIQIMATYDHPGNYFNSDLASGGSAYQRGDTVWVWSPTTSKGLFRYAAQPGVDVESIKPWTATLSLSALLTSPPDARSAFVSSDRFYLIYGTFGTPDRLRVYDLATLTQISDVEAIYGEASGGRVNIFTRDDSRVYVAADVAGTVTLYSWDGTSWTTHGALSGAGSASGYWGSSDHPATWFVGDGLVIWHIGAALHYWALDAINAQTVMLSTIVSDICASAGLESGDINVTALASVPVRGYLRNAQMTARAALEPLASGFFFDAVESGDKIVFKRRGGASVATIDYDDLGAASEGSQEDRIVTTVTQDNELPIELNMQYTDPARDFQIGSQRSRRQIPKSQKIDTVQMPIAWSGTDAKQAVEKLHYTAWESRTVHAFSLPLKYLRLEPADVITLPINNVSRRVRLTKTTVGSVIQCEAESDYAANYISESIAAENPAGPQEILVPGTTIMQILDIPILQDADNDAGFYVAAMGTGTGWTGAAIYKSADNVTFDEADVVTVESEMGSATNLLPAGPTTIWDDGNTVTVRLIEGALTSTTDLNAMSGINTLAIGAPGRWEIMSFVNATLNGDGTYTLSRLLRGRLGTEWAVGLHAIGDAVVMLEAGALTRIVPATADIGVPRYYKAISFGGDESDVITYTHQAVGLEPYAPVHIRGRRHSPSTNDWNITWVRRTRVDGGWRDYVDVPLGEASENYEIDIMSGSTVKRTLTATSQTVTYTAAMQTTDFGAVQTGLSVRVYQLSGTTGRGYVASATI